MMRSLWISKTGMEAQQTQLDTISNNLANVGTNGFKRVARGVRGPDVPEPAPGRRQQHRADAAADRPAGRPRRARRRHRAQLQPGQPAADQQPARRRDPGQRLLPDPDARRHHRLHARRLVPGRRAGPARHQQRLHGAARHHDPGATRRASRSAATARSRVTLPGQAAPQPVGQLQLASFVNPAGLEPQGPEPLRRDRRLGHAERRRAGQQRPRHAAAGLSSRPRTSTSSRSWWR